MSPRSKRTARFALQTAISPGQDPTNLLRTHGSRSRPLPGSRFTPLDAAPEAGVRNESSRCSPTVLIATSHRDAPARGGAFADERRIAVTTKADGRFHRRACASLVASFAAGVPIGGRWPGLRRLRVGRVG
jgi:hypothetical protein